MSTRQCVDLCIACVGANKPATGQAGTVALILGKMAVGKYRQQPLIFRRNGSSKRLNV